MNSIQIQNCLQKLQQLQSQVPNPFLHNRFQDLMMEMESLIDNHLDIRRANFHYQYGYFLLRLIEKDPNLNTIINNNQVQNHQESDLQVAYENISVSIHIYQCQIKKYKDNQQQVPYSLLKLLAQSEKTLGDLYVWCQKYSEANAQYQKWKAYLMSKPQKNYKQMSQIDYLLGHTIVQSQQPNSLQMGKQYLISSIYYLINQLNNIMHTNYQKPTSKNSFINRLPYLPCSQDTKQTSDLKMVICIFLDKIQDLTYQIIENGQYLDVIKNALGELSSMSSNVNKQNIKQVTKECKYLGVFGVKKQNQDSNFTSSFCNNNKRINI